VMTLHDSALSLADAAAATHVLELESCAEPNVVMLTDKKHLARLAALQLIRGH